MAAILRSFLIDQDIPKYKWEKDAACYATDPEIFFSTSSRSYSTKIALQICAQCPVKNLCRQHALKNKEIGVWGQYFFTTKHHKTTKSTNLSDETNDEVFVNI